MFKHQSFYALLAGSLGLSLLATAGCGAEDRPGIPTNGDGQALYAIGFGLNTPDGRSNVLGLVPTLEPQAPLDTRQAIEVSGFSRFYFPKETKGFFGVGDDEDITISRFDVASEGTITQSGRFSMQGVGVQWFMPVMQFLSDEKAYYFDHSQDQIVVWNPTTMTITKTVPLPPEAIKQGFHVQFPQARGRTLPVSDDGKLLVPIGWYDWDNERILMSTGLMVVDVATDNVEAVRETTACPMALDFLVAESGDLYVGSNLDLLRNEEMRANDERPSCILRVNAGETDFDASYRLALSDRLDGRASVGLFPLADTKALVRVLDETILPYGTPAGAEFWAPSAWEYWTLDLLTGAASQIESLDPASLGGETFEVDGRTFLPVTTRPDGAATDHHTVLVELAPSGERTDIMSNAGFLAGLARVR